MRNPNPLRFPALEWDIEAREERPCVILERNGNLILVEREDGSVDWRAPHEIEELR